MALTTFVITIRDGASTPPGARKTGLTPTWVFLNNLVTNVPVSAPTIFEIAQGQYKFSYDPSVIEATGQIDAGPSLANPADRYIDVTLTKDSGGNNAASYVTAILTDATPSNFATAGSLGGLLTQLIGTGEYTTVLASPTPTPTSFSIALRTQLDANALSGRTTLKFLSGANEPSALPILTATRGAGTTVALTFAAPGFADAPVGSENVVIY